MKTIATATVERWANSLVVQAELVRPDTLALDREVVELIDQVKAFAAGVRFWGEANTVPPVKRPRKSKRFRKR